jgi:hypothetical protein
MAMTTRKVGKWTATVTKRAMALGWCASNGNGDKEVDVKGNEIALRAMATVMRVAGKWQQ